MGIFGCLALFVAGILVGMNGRREDDAVSTEKCAQGAEGYAGDRQPAGRSFGQLGAMDGEGANALGKEPTRH